MIPYCFAVEYARRCLDLIEMMEAQARKNELVGSFALLAAAAVFTVPYERGKARHFLARDEREAALFAALKNVEKSQKFIAADFWERKPPGDWRYSRICTDPIDSRGWMDEQRRHPMDPGAANTIHRITTGDVLRVVRNALAHGNIVYLDAYGRERSGHMVKYLAFLSHYKETEAEQKEDGTYRLVVTTEDDFLNFVRAWANWLTTIPLDYRFVEAA